MTDIETKILETLSEMSAQLAEINVFLETLNSNQCKTDVKVTDIKISLMNNGE